MQLGIQDNGGRGYIADEMLLPMIQKFLWIKIKSRWSFIQEGLYVEKVSYTDDFDETEETILWES